MLKFDLAPPRRQLIQFGWIATVGFPLLGAMLNWRIGWDWAPWSPLWTFVSIGAAMGLLAGLGAAAAIRPVYVAMMVVAFPIGFVLSNVLLGLVYFGMFAPVGLLFRLTGRDLLHRYPDPTATSYWRVRERQRSPASYLRLY